MRDTPELWSVLSVGEDPEQFLALAQTYFSRESLHNSSFPLFALFGAIHLLPELDWVAVDGCKAQLVQCADTSYHGCLAAVHMI